MRDLASGNDDHLRTLVRDAFLQGWHGAMCARDDDSIHRGCPSCGEGMAPGDDSCALCGHRLVDEPTGDAVFEATAADAAATDERSIYWLPGPGWYYVDDEAQEPVGPFPTRDAAVEAKRTRRDAP